jgi:thiamine biosynthesis lipoprotein
MTSADPPGRAENILPGRARILLPVFLVALVVISVHRLVCAPPPPAAAEFSGRSMGTTWAVTLALPDLPAPARAEIQAAIEARLGQVDALMSTYREDSELSRFNRAAAGAAFAVSPEMLEVFRVAAEVSELSDGAFDVTVGPLVAAWGFGATDRVPGEPPAAELAALRERVGYRELVVDSAGHSLRKTRADIRCDLSAIAKGYAVDRVAEALGSLGFADFLVEVGGEVRARGRRLDGGPWRVAIERPEVDRRAVFEVVPLRDLALATSGDYRNYVDLGGRRISHTIDPRTGRPVEHGLASVSVLHRDAIHADALATALNVLGPEAGYALADREGLAAYFIVRRADGSFAARSTSAFGRETADGPERLEAAAE